MSCPIPVPPLAEQKIIVQRVESLMQQCDMVDRGENIDNMPVIHPQAVTQLKQSILQEAIQGKLTEDWRKKTLILNLQANF